MERRTAEKTDFYIPTCSVQSSQTLLLLFLELGRDRPATQQRRPDIRTTGWLYHSVHLLSVYTQVPSYISQKSALGDIDTLVCEMK